MVRSNKIKLSIPHKPHPSSVPPPEYGNFYVEPAGRNKNLVETPRVIQPTIRNNQEVDMDFAIRQSLQEDFEKRGAVIHDPRTLSAGQARYEDVSIPYQREESIRGFTNPVAKKTGDERTIDGSEEYIPKSHKPRSRNPEMPVVVQSEYYGDNQPHETPRSSMRKKGTRISIPSKPTIQVATDDVNEDEYQPPPNTSYSRFTKSQQVTQQIPVEEIDNHPRVVPSVRNPSSRGSLKTPGMTIIQYDEDGNMIPPPPTYGKRSTSTNRYFGPSEIIDDETQPQPQPVLTAPKIQIQKPVGVIDDLNYDEQITVPKNKVISNPPVQQRSIEIAAMIEEMVQPPLPNFYNQPLKFPEPVGTPSIESTEELTVSKPREVVPPKPQIPIGTPSIESQEEIHKPKRPLQQKPPPVQTRLGLPAIIEDEQIYRPSPEIIHQRAQMIKAPLAAGVLDIIDQAIEEVRMPLTKSSKPRVKSRPVEPVIPESDFQERHETLKSIREVLKAAVPLGNSEIPYDYSLEPSTKFRIRQSLPTVAPEVSLEFPVVEPLDTKISFTPRKSARKAITLVDEGEKEFLTVEQERSLLQSSVAATPTRKSIYGRMTSITVEPDPEPQQPKIFPGLQGIRS